jgi:transcriptional regulator with XRE-family HTH domain
MNIRKTVGLNVQRLRHARKPEWRQAKVAADAKISMVYISQIESGKRAPSIDVMIRLAKAFNVSLDELVKPIPPGYVPPKKLPRGPNVHHQGRKRAKAK